MLDTTDLIILILVSLGTLAYFTKGKLWAKPAQIGYGYGSTGKGTANGIAKPKKTRNIVERMDQQNKNVVVFFGSQTGTAGMYPQSKDHFNWQRIILPALQKKDILVMVSIR
jgi:NADPH-ferrihemoprotein reductase